MRQTGKDFNAKAQRRGDFMPQIGTDETQIATGFKDRHRNKARAQGPNKPGAAGLPRNDLRARANNIRRYLLLFP
jgi:hypothetical protein